jgi:hypothetical protein
MSQGTPVNRWPTAMLLPSGGRYTCTMRMMRHFLLACILCWGGQTLAQGSGTLRLLVDPDKDFQFVVDKKHRMAQREITLTEGLHELSIWAPERMVVDTPVFVIANKTSDLVVRLPYSPEYKAYRDELSKYNTARRLRMFSPVVLVAGLVWTGASIGKYTSTHDQLETDRKTYDTSMDPALINKLKDVEIPAHKDEFRKARNSFYTGAALTVVGAGVLYWVRSSTKGLTEPTFEDKEKIRFEGLTWHRMPTGDVWGASLSIPLAR